MKHQQYDGDKGATDASTLLAVPQVVDGKFILQVDDDNFDTTVSYMPGQST